MNPKPIYAKTVALLLCSIVLFSSFGLTLNMHLCQGKVKTFSFIGEAQKCVEMNENDVCNSKKNPFALTKRKCCTEASIKAETSTQDIPVINKQVQKLVLVFNSYVNLIASITPAIKSDINQYHTPPPELSGRTLLVFYQTYLI
jgi:hypothetical protein